MLDFVVFIWKNSWSINNLLKIDTCELDLFYTKKNNIEEFFPFYNEGNYLLSDVSL